MKITEELAKELFKNENLNRSFILYTIIRDEHLEEEIKYINENPETLKWWQTLSVEEQKSVLKKSIINEYIRRVNEDNKNNGKKSIESKNLVR